MRKHTFILGVISSSIFFLGLVFRNFHLMGAGFLIGGGIILFILGFGVSFLIDRITIESRRSYRVAILLLGVSVGLLIACALLAILRWFELSRSLAFAGVIIFCIFAVYFNRNIEGRQLRIRKDRQLAAILFTDIKGFTAMMGSNELETIKALERNRSVQKRIIRKFRGKWIKEIGDATLSIFYTASEAVLSAKEIQDSIKNDSSIELRMGIHVGEIIFTDDDIYGDGVNIASRIADAAGSGEVCFTEIVYQNIRNREDLQIISEGQKSLKNVEDPVRIFKIKA